MFFDLAFNVVKDRGVGFEGWKESEAEGVDYTNAVEVTVAPRHIY